MSTSIKELDHNESDCSRFERNLWWIGWEGSDQMFALEPPAPWRTTTTTIHDLLRLSGQTR